MKYPVYVYYDRVACEYSGPVLEVNAGTAQRNFNFKCSQSPVNGCDTELYYLGEYDTTIGSFVSLLEKPSFVCRYEVGINEK